MDNYLPQNYLNYLTDIKDSQKILFPQVGEDRKIILTPLYKLQDLECSNG